MSLHREKLRAARRMMTPAERKKGTPPFQSAAWKARKELIKKRLERQKLKNAKRKAALKKKK